LANIKTSESKNKARKAIVIPRTNDGYKEKFAIANGKRISFERPCMLTPDDVKALENQKEPIQVSGGETVYDIMQKLQVDQKKAAAILANKQANNLNNSISWKQKYIVQYV
jgi:hypothetical protein